MGITREEALVQIDVLLEEFSRAKSASPYDDLSGGLSDDELGAIKTRMLAAVARIAPGNNEYSREARTESPGVNGFQGYAVVALTGVLRALRSDVDAGYMQSFEELVHADLFSDFLERAEELQRAGHKDAAAVIAGSTLEEHLRKLADKENVPITKADGSPKKADTLNSELTSTGAYNKLEQKSVTAWLGVRNSAAHGQYEDYDSAQVANLIQGVRDFLSRHPA